MKMAINRKKSGFTLIELMVAMAILLIILVICAQIFQQARVAWSSGQDLVDMNMTGRAVVDCIFQELTQAVDTNVVISASSITFTKIGTAASGTPALQEVTYNFDGSYVLRNSVKICPSASVSTPRPGIMSLAFSPTTTPGVLPDYVDIVATVGIQGSALIDTYKTRVCFPNRKRYELP